MITSLLLLAIVSRQAETNENGNAAEKQKSELVLKVKGLVRQLDDDELEWIRRKVG